jgi:hypothetical protein
MSLRDRFPRLFSISVQQQATVASVCVDNGQEGWNLIWRRRLFVWETTLLNDLLLLLNSVRLTEAMDDWNSIGGEGDNFSVKSAYVMVSDMLIPMEFNSPIQELAFKINWKCIAPSMVTGFAWLVLRDRVPTRENLIRRRIVLDNDQNRCIFCGDHAETAQHLFLYCNAILNWLGLNLSLPHSIMSILIFMAQTHGSKKKRQGLVLIWKAVIWTIWRHRNKVMFDNGRIDLVSLVDEVKTVSWRWWLGRTINTPACFMNGFRSR